MELTPCLLHREYFRSRVWVKDEALLSEWGSKKFLVYISTPVGCYCPLRWILTGEQNWEVIRSSYRAHHCSLCQLDHKCRKVAFMHWLGFPRLNTVLLYMTDQSLRIFCSKLQALFSVFHRQKSLFICLI